ncbi:MAG: heat-inducible transcriptional repressor HrcA [Tissierellia bacterium]|nr:heat-inducible transcriptional repressor HrcA [Tissierellia bacterium]
MLDERKLSILYAIINSYIRHAEPVGSRTISKQYDLGVSSATIRNEMSDLEGLGYLNKAHSSSGRIPSDKAYRHYVNSLLSEVHPYLNPLQEDFGNLLLQDASQIEALVSNSARILSEITKYTSLALMTNVGSSKLQKIQLIELSPVDLVLVMVYDKDNVKHTILRVEQGIDTETIQRLNHYLDKYLVGMDLVDLPKAIDDILVMELNSYRGFLTKLKEIVRLDIQDLEETVLLFDGVSNIFNYPEYRDIERAKSFVDFLEDKEAVISALLNGDVPNLQVSIGGENKATNLNELSIITANYVIGDNRHGRIGIIGPKRMDYGTVIDTIVTFANELNKRYYDR